MDKRFEITIRELTPYTEEELKDIDRNMGRRSNNDFGFQEQNRFSDRPVHVVRVLHAEVTGEEVVAVRNAIIGNFK